MSWKVKRHDSERLNWEAEENVMAWLKEHREQGGQQGAEFEAAWKNWCKEHGLNALVKSQRITSIAAFREAWKQGPASEAPEAGHGSQEERPDDPGRPAGPELAAAAEGAAAREELSALAPDPSSLGALAPTFARAPGGEAALLRLLGDRLLGRPDGPHEAPSWEAGP